MDKSYVYLVKQSIRGATRITKHLIVEETKSKLKARNRGFLKKRMGMLQGTLDDWWFYVDDFDEAVNIAIREMANKIEYTKHDKRDVNYYIKRDFADKVGVDMEDIDEYPELVEALEDIIAKKDKRYDAIIDKLTKSLKELKERYGRQ